MRDISVLRQHPEMQVLASRYRQVRAATPPARGRKPAGLANASQPQARVRQNDEEDPAQTRGSFGRPRIISPMMLRWICEDPA